MTPADPLPRPGAFVAALAEHVFPRHRDVDRQEHHEVHFLDLTSLKLLAGAFTPFVVPHHLAGRATVTAKDLAALLEDLSNIRRGVHADFVVLVVEGRLAELDEQCRGTLGRESIVVLDRQAITAIFAELPHVRRVQAALVQELVRFLGRMALSPYEPGQPARGERFFGRRDALKDAMPSRRGEDITIMGCRRIGKTSLLGEIRRRLEASGPDHVRVAEIYASTYPTTLKVLEAITRQVCSRQTIAQRHIDDPHFEDKFPEIIRSIADKESVEVAVLIDEVDELLEIDTNQGERLMKKLRATFQSTDRCRVVFAGFRRVMMERLRPGSEMFNFTKPVELRGLTRPEAREMVRGPLELLDIAVGDGHQDFIYHETKGHPELIQMYCSQIIKMVEATGALPTPSDLVRDVVQTQMFREKVFAAFLSSANAYEELLCYLLVARWRDTDVSIGDFHFDVEDANEILTELKVVCRVREIEALLRNLCMVSIIEEVPGTVRYRFAVPALANYILRHNLQFLTKKALRSIDDGLAPPVPLWVERKKT